MPNPLALTKPFDAIEVMLRVINLPETRRLVPELTRQGIASPFGGRPRL